MNQRRVVAQLKEVGLPEREALVYLATLSLGPTTALLLAKETGLKRTSVYPVLEALKRRGLIATELHGWKERFAAADPKTLSINLKRQKEEFETLLPELSSLYNLKDSGTTFKYFEGLSGIKSVYEQLLKDTPPKSDYLIISDIGEWLEADEKFFSNFAIRRAKLNVKTRMLLLDTEHGRKYKSMERNLNAQIKLLPKNTAFKTNAVIASQRLVIHQLKLPMMALTVENQSIIQMHREMFEVIWKSLPD